MMNSFNKIVSWITALVLMAVIVVSCNTKTVFDQNVELSSKGWYKDTAVSFNVNISDSLTNYVFGLNIRNTTDYRYSNLYIFLITEFPNGNVSHDTIECILANKEGKWLGKGWGNIKENQIVLKSGLRFPLTGKYKFLIQHAMRVDTLMGISDVGLSLITEDNL